MLARTASFSCGSRVPTPGNAGPEPNLHTGERVATGRTAQRLHKCVALRPMALRQAAGRAHPVAMEEAGLTPADCRGLREAAQVSIHELARQLHRDPSSLSRWERGQQVPRDVDAVRAAYRALKPVAPHTLAQPHRTQQRTLTYHVEGRYLAALIGRWVLFGVIVSFAEAAGAPNVFAADALRVFIACSAVIALALMVGRFRRLQRVSTTSRGGQLIVLAWGLAVGFCAWATLEQLGHMRLRAPVAGWALLIIETSLLGLAWHVEEPLVEAVARDSDRP